MKIRTTVKGGIAIDPRTIVYFNKGDIITPGDKGLLEHNLKRLVEIKQAEFVKEDVEPKKDDKKVSDEKQAEKKVEKSVEKPAKSVAKVSKTKDDLGGDL